MTQFHIDLIRAGHRLRTLGADQFAVALTQAVHGHFDRAFAHAQGNSQIGIGSLASFAGEIIPGPLEQVASPPDRGATSVARYTLGG